MGVVNKEMRSFAPNANGRYDEIQRSKTVQNTPESLSLEYLISPEGCMHKHSHFSSRLVTSPDRPVES